MDTHFASIKLLMKSSAFRIRIEPELHEQFLDVCKKQDIPAAQVVRQFIRDYIEYSTEMSPQRDFFLNQPRKNG